MTKEIIPIDLCDDIHDLGHAAVYLPWTRDLLKKLLYLYLLPLGTGLQKAQQFKWKVSAVDERPDSQEVFPQIPNVSLLKVVRNEKTTSENHLQEFDIRQLRLKAGDPMWNQGDVASIKAQNSEDNLKKTVRFETVIQVKEYDSGKKLFIQ